MRAKHTKKLIFALKKRQKIAWERYVDYMVDIELSNGIGRQFRTPNYDEKWLYYGKSGQFSQNTNNNRQTKENKQ